MIYNDIEINPYKFNVKVRMPKTQKEKRQPLDRETITAVLNVMPLQIKILSMLMISTLRRPNELFQLRVRDVDFDSNPPIVRIPSNVSKNRAENFTFLTKECKALLLQYLGKRVNMDTLLFHNYKSPRSAVLTFARAFRRHMDKLPNLNLKKSSKPRNYRVSLYSFKDFAFTKVQRKFDDDFARELKGDRTTQYSNYTVEEKRQMYLELEPELTIFNAEGIKREFETKYANQAKELEELRKKEDEKENEIKKLNGRVQEMEITMGVVRPLLGQMAKETKTKRFIFTGPEGDKLATILTKDLKKLEED